MGIFQRFFEVQVKEPSILEAQNSNPVEAQIENEIYWCYVANKNRLQIHAISLIAMNTCPKSLDH